MKLSNFTLKNVFYFLQGNWRMWNYNLLKWLTMRMGFYERQVNRKKEICKSCWDAGVCEHCGCAVVPLFFSDKPCSAGKF